LPKTGQLVADVGVAVTARRRRRAGGTLDTIELRVVGAVQLKRADAVRIRTHSRRENRHSDREKHSAQQQKARLAPQGSNVSHRQLHVLE
jgi:hypothetical protein